MMQMGEAEKAEGWRCKICDEVYEEEYEAQCCCDADKQEQIDAWKCVECECIFETEKQAKFCCRDDVEE
jgi:hypothetical protein